MKKLICLLFFGLLGNSAFAEFAVWTNSAGRTAELDLVSVSEKDGEKTGEFKTKTGQSVSIKASDLDLESARRLAEWKPVPVTRFDSYLEDSLVKLEGKSFKQIEGFVKPTEYYLFYYAASWCPHCQKFAPQILKFYENYKDARVEVIVISGDRDENAMRNYAIKQKMSWPHIEFSQVEKFKKEMDLPTTSYPHLVLTDAEGEVINPSEDKDEYPLYDITLYYIEQYLKRQP